MKKLLLFMLLLTSVSTGRAGIYRHDVPAERYKENAAQSQFDCVGVMLNNKGISGSCVLVGSKYVLSAAHCFVESETEKDTIMAGKTQITVFKQVNRRQADISDYQFRFGRKHYRGKTLKFYSTYWNKETEGNCDIVLIELEDEVTEIPPAKICTSFDELNSVVTGVGFGASGRADNPDDVSIYLEKIAGENVVDEISGYEIGVNPTIMSCDFDHPVLEKCNQTGTSKPQTLEYICSGGDSGGGLFRQKNGKWELVGICSGSGTNIEKLHTTGYYGQVMSWTRVSVFADWIQKSINDK